MNDQTKPDVPADVAATDDAIAAGASIPWQPGEREQALATHAAVEALRKAAEAAWGTAPDFAGRAILTRYAVAAVEAVWPFGTAAGRAQAAAELLAYADNYPENVFPPDSDSRDAIGGTAMRHAYRNAARIAEGSGADA